MRRRLNLHCYLFEHNCVVYVLVNYHLKFHTSGFYLRKIVKIKINKCLKLQVFFQQNFKRLFVFVKVEVYGLDF